MEVSTKNTKPEFTVIGSGLSGCLMAVYLAKLNYKVELYERNSDPRTSAASRGRSINLALSRRGIAALEEIGIAKELLKLAIPMRGRMIHPTSAILTFQPYGKDSSEAIYSISRNKLNSALLDLAENFPNIKIFFDHICSGADLKNFTVELNNQKNNQKITIPVEIAIGADGAYSAIRKQMETTERYNYSQQFLTHGYKELTIPPTSSGNFALDSNCLHIWPRHDFMMIALPNLDKSFTCTLFFPFEGEKSFSSLNTQQDVNQFFTENFSDAVPLMPTLVEDFFENPTGAMVTVRCSPWHYLDRFVLIGDAAHAVVPFYGQGMNASFEDCSVLNSCIKSYEPSWERVFQEYEIQRKRNTDALSELAVENYLEMRSKVTSRIFLLKKKVETFLTKLFPNHFLPLYTMISFTQIPYAKAIAKAKKQDIRLLFGSGIFLLVLIIIVIQLILSWGLSSIQ